MEKYILKKPDITGLMHDMIPRLNNIEDLFVYIQDTSTPQYLFWDKVRYLPRPENLSDVEFWAVVKFHRRIVSGRVNTQVRDEKGHFFSWQPIPGLDHFLHEMDMNLGGVLKSAVANDDPTRKAFIMRGIMEEAIASSQLEGAVTTRAVAKKILTEKRTPANRSEHMIVNNYRAMREIEEDLRHQEISKDFLLHLHSLLTKDTIDADQTGRFRTDSDDIVVCNPTTNVVYHTPPREKVLLEELDRLIEFGRGTSDQRQYIHPVIKAIILHFWIAYLHPFTDGNGRLARTLFYWYLLKEGYWAISYLPLSRVIRSSPGKYRDAFVYTEQDDNDLTYFIDYNVRKINQARAEFEEYLKRKMSESRTVLEKVRSQYDLNDRQIQILRYLHKNPTSHSSIKVHAQVNEISRMTARKDLEGLETLGLLSSKKVGRDRPFKATEKARELLR